MNTRTVDDVQLTLFDYVSGSDSSSGVVSVVGDDAQDPFASARSDPGTISLTEALGQWDVVAVDDDRRFMIMADRDPNLGAGGDSDTIRLRDPGMPVTTAFQEMGYVAPSPFTSWTRQDDNVKLRGQAGLRVYYNMRRQDGAIRASQRLVKTPPQGAHWFVEPWTPDEDTPPTEADKSIANFVSRNLFEDLNVTWAVFLNDALLMLDYGYMAFEKVFGVGIDGKIHLTKLAPRHPLDIQEWVYDINGGPDGCIMYANPYSGPSLLTPGTGMGVPGLNDPSPFIPITKLVVYTHEPEAGDITGISILRSAYKHWYYKDTLYKIDAIQKERHGIGIPIIKLPLGFTPQDKNLAEDLGRNLRTNERSHVTLPPQWDIVFAKLEGQPVDCLKSVEHHDMRIKSNVLGSFLDATTGQQDSNVDVFLKSTRYIADFIAEITNKHVIKQLVDFNFYLGRDRGYPKLRARRIGEWEDLRTLSFAIRNLVGIDAIRPDDVLEAHIRREMDLPLADPKTARSPILVRPQTANTPLAKGEETAISDYAAKQVTQDIPDTGVAPNGQQKQNASENRGGAPRQSPTPPSRQAGNAGTDRSGG
jgi:hypothetical protein